MRRNTVLTIVALASAGLLLTGCQKPAPAISVWSGTESLNEAALCWAFDSDQLEPTQCAEDILQGRKTDGLAILEPVSGNTVGISVDKEVAASGWTLTLGGQTITPNPLTTTYFRFTMPLVQPNTQVPLQIIAGTDGKTRGIWSVLLLPRAS